MTNLNTKAWLSLAVLAIVMGLLLFVPAWTVHYWQAWVYLRLHWHIDPHHALSHETRPGAS